MCILLQARNHSAFEQQLEREIIRWFVARLRSFLLHGAFCFFGCPFFMYIKIFINLNATVQKDIISRMKNIELAFVYIEKITRKKV